MLTVADNYQSPAQLYITASPRLVYNIVNLNRDFLNYEKSINTGDRVGAIDDDALW